VLPAMAAIVAAVILSRFAWIFPAVYLPRWLVPALRHNNPVPPLAVPVVMSWAGMRGVVSLAGGTRVAGAIPWPRLYPGDDVLPSF
jgi:NhaP-type Na+/H+ or K+/H+ antiporter